MLTIANFEANYFIPKGTPDPAALRTWLDRLVRHRLSNEASGRLRSPAADDTAVYRIRHLQIDLWLDVLGMEDGAIAQQWAALTLKAVTHALLYGSATEVVRYEDHAHFVAAFLGDLLAGRAWSRWMYEEFTPLRDLPVGQVTAQLLAARPQLLVPVAQCLARQSQLESLIQQLQLADIRLILREGLGFAAPPAFLAVDAVLQQILQLLQGGVALESGAAVAQARNTLRLFLAVVLAQSEPIKQSAVMAVCHHLALLYNLWTRRPSPTLWQALAAGEITTPAVLTPLLTSLEADLPQLCAWLQSVLVTLPGRAYLAQLIPVVVPTVGEPAPVVRGEEQGTARLQGARVAPVERVASSFAGLALLLPMIRELELHEAIGNAGLYQLLLAAVGRTLQPLAWGDLGVAWLAGITPAAMERARGEAIAWPAVPGAPDVQPVTAWTQVIVRRFAQGLRGFTQSSPAYLAQQFLNLPGQFARTDETLEVFLSRAPLGIVLYMAGYDGDQGVVPWLDERRLVIHLPEG